MAHKSRCLGEHFRGILVRRCCILSSSEVIEIYCDLFFVNKAPKHFYLCFSCEFQKECLV